LDVLTRQSQQMARLLDDLLEVSRVTQDKIELKKRVLDLRGIVEDAAGVVHDLMDARGIRFSVDLDPEPLHVDGDASRLQQIQVNLLNNAAKYTPAGGQVRLSARREGGQAVLRVRDDGMGIPQHLLEDVFELFVQSHRTLDRSEGGLGVGLTLVRGLVVQHGGSVVAHSDGEGKGSEFVVSLPLVDRVPEPEPCPKASEPSPVAAADSLRIVVVEDNEDSRIMLCELLELAGFHCQTADNGAAGLRLIDELCPDLALIDIGLPEIDGLELARRLRRNPDHVRLYLVALTGYGQREDRENARAAGFDQHLVKPVDSTTLLRVLTDLQIERRAATS
jgi:two-component system CheB/CheR fusion protein